MTTVERKTQITSYHSEVYDPEDVVLRDSPLLEPIRPSLIPSPSPPPMVPLPKFSPDSSPDAAGRKTSRSKNRPSLSDAVLVQYMDGGKPSDISRTAGNEPLPSDDEGEEPVKGAIEMDMTVDRAGGFANGGLHYEKTEDKSEANVDMDAPEEDKIEDPLEVLALNALRHIAQSTQRMDVKTNGHHEAIDRPRDEIEGVKVPSIIVDGVRSGLPTVERNPLPTGELPPIRQHPPNSGPLNGNNSGQITLPSLSDQLGNLNRLPDVHSPRESATFTQSPPAPHHPRFSAVANHGSPPKSPNDFRALPSPGRGGFNFYNHNQRRRLSQTDVPQYSSGGDYSSSVETPSTDNSAPTPAMGLDRMSIVEITNPQIGGFQCNNPGCNAPPFQTQYLLNSHANVHSQNRPHYCGVKGCPRSEGGKGFKRKNEMIRHGLVHDSPGYVCPFCPDREHKYPRPDNLQRHVRVHHVDKDKDDAELREVLSQRPEGPSRGRRRRGGTA